MKLSYNQLVAIPFGYSNNGSYRTYKGRYPVEAGEQLNKLIANAQITHLFYTRTKKVILTVTTGSASHVWDIIQNFKAKSQQQTAKQLTMKLL